MIKLPLFTKIFVDFLYIRSNRSLTYVFQVFHHEFVSGYLRICDTTDISIRFLMCFLLQIPWWGFILHAYEVLCSKLFASMILMGVRLMGRKKAMFQYSNRGVRIYVHVSLIPNTIHCSFLQSLFVYLINTNALLATVFSLLSTFYDII